MDHKQTEGEAKSQSNFRNQSALHLIIHEHKSLNPWSEVTGGGTEYRKSSPHTILKSAFYTGQRPELQNWHEIGYSKWNNKIRHKKSCLVKTMNLSRSKIVKC